MQVKERDRYWVIAYSSMEWEYQWERNLYYPVLDLQDMVCVWANSKDLSKVPINGLIVHGVKFYKMLDGKEFWYKPSSAYFAGAKLCILGECFEFLGEWNTFYMGKQEICYYPATSRFDLVYWMDSADGVWQLGFRFYDVVTPDEVMLEVRVWLDVVNKCVLGFQAGYGEMGMLGGLPTVCQEKWNRLCARRARAALMRDRRIY